ncbi:MAG: hypothetical protein SFZ03_02955 [Candidatus Melainabacteria bacterium]|nr:hypothetical protein [Candidatus Melainabacteria bacterium]
MPTIQNCRKCSIPFERAGHHTICPDCREMEALRYNELIRQIRAAIERIHFGKLEKLSHIEASLLEDGLYYLIGQPQRAENSDFLKSLQKGQCSWCGHWMLNKETKEPVCLPCLNHVVKHLEDCLRQTSPNEKSPTERGGSAKPTPQANPAVPLSALGPLNNKVSNISPLHTEPKGTTAPEEAVNAVVSNVSSFQCRCCGDSQHFQASTCLTCYELSLQKLKDYKLLLQEVHQKLQETPLIASEPTIAQLQEKLMAAVEESIDYLNPSIASENTEAAPHAKLTVEELESILDQPEANIEMEPIEADKKALLLDNPTRYGFKRSVESV